MVEKYIFAGGCHVGGYLVGVDNAFSMKLIGALDHSGAVTISRPLAVRNTAKYLRSCIEQGGATTSLVLQLGNFETGVSLIPKVLGGTALGSAGGLAQDVVLAERRAKSFRALVGFVPKILLLAYYDAISKSKFDSEKFEAEVADLFGKISSMGFKKVIVLSAFPSLHPTLNIYRRRASKILERLSGRLGYVYVDVFTPLNRMSPLEAAIDGHQYFIDNEHLNRAGHVVVANCLRAVIRAQED